MPENTPALRRCNNCDGFSTAAIATGQTLADGQRQTIKVTCHTCRGTGTASVRRPVRVTR
jgi:DnaJ-class molecular chaperone